MTYYIRCCVRACISTNQKMKSGLYRHATARPFNPYILCISINFEETIAFLQSD